MARGLNWPRERAESVVKEAAAVEPLYQHAYSAMAHYLLPRWHGEPGASCNGVMPIAKSCMAPASDIALSILLSYFSSGIALDGAMSSVRGSSRANTEACEARSATLSTRTPRARIVTRDFREGDTHFSRSGNRLCATRSITVHLPNLSLASLSRRRGQSQVNQTGSHRHDHEASVTTEKDRDIGSFVAARADF